MHPESVFVKRRSQPTEEHCLACLRLRLGDLEFERRALVVRDDEDVKTAMIYTHVLNQGRLAVHSRLDQQRPRSSSVNLGEATETGTRIAALVQREQLDEAYMLLAPILAERTPFRLLDRIGQTVGASPLPEANGFLDRIAADRTEGGWVVIGSTLGQQLDRDLSALMRCRSYVITADVWYATDILGERVPGPALVAGLEPALALLSPWRQDVDRWVRRTVGVAIHFWAKRSQGVPELRPQAKALLAFLEPMFGERNLDAVKGVGWGLKTLGKYYPDLVADWLAEQVGQRQRKPRALMLRKAHTYLSAEQRARSLSAIERVPVP
jgi:hypothetical protein